MSLRNWIATKAYQVQAVRKALETWAKMKWGSKHRMLFSTRGCEKLALHAARVQCADSIQAELGVEINVVTSVIGPVVDILINLIQDTLATPPGQDPHSSPEADEGRYLDTVRGAYSSEDPPFFLPISMLPQVEPTHPSSTNPQPALPDIEPALPLEEPVRQKHPSTTCAYSISNPSFAYGETALSPCLVYSASALPYSASTPIYTSSTLSLIPSEHFYRPTAPLQPELISPHSAQPSIALAISCPMPSFQLSACSPLARAASVVSSHTISASTSCTVTPGPHPTPTVKNEAIVKVEDPAP